MKELLLTQRTNPIFQVGLILILMILFMGIYQLSLSEAAKLDNPAGAWELMAAFVLFYALVNCVFSLQTPNQMIYWRNSIFSFAGLLLLGGGICYLFTGISLQNAGSIRWILFVFSFGYLIFLSIANLMRFIVELAQKQDSKLRGEDEN